MHSVTERTFCSQQQKILRWQDHLQCLYPLELLTGSSRWHTTAGQSYDEPWYSGFRNPEK